MKRLIAITAAFWLLLGGVAAAQYATSDVPLDVDVATLEAGDTLTAGGGGFEPGSNVEVVVIAPDGTETVLAEFTADENGDVSGQVTIPADFAGDGTLVARGTSVDGGTQVLGVSIVRGEVENLARTGAGATTHWAFSIGVTTIVAGSLVLLFDHYRVRRA